MTENKRQTEDLQLKRVRFNTWMEWWMQCKTVHDRFGTPYADFEPPAYLVEKLGAMPVPPWVRADGTNRRVR